MQSTKDTAAKAAEDAIAGLPDLGMLTTDAVAKLGVSPDVLAPIKALLANPAVAQSLGPTLEKLQSLLQ